LLESRVSNASRLWPVQRRSTPIAEAAGPDPALRRKLFLNHGHVGRNMQPGVAVVQYEPDTVALLVQR